MFVLHFIEKSTIPETKKIIKIGNEFSRRIVRKKK